MIKIIEIPELLRAGERFAQLHTEPLLVTAIIAPGSPLVDYEPINLDSLLAKALLIMALGTTTLPDVDGAYYLPLPLKALWFSPEGLPLWAASVLLPLGEQQRHTVYLHKRNGNLQFSNKARIETNKGRYMERRIPVPVRTFGPRAGLQAHVIGNKEALENILQTVTHIGKHRKRIGARVLEWRVTPAVFEPEATYTDGTRLTKAIPVAAEVLTVWPSAPVNCGWTPPQWKPQLHSLGWRVGTVLPAHDFADFFSAVDTLKQVAPN